MMQRANVDPTDVLIAALAGIGIRAARTSDVATWPRAERNKVLVRIGDPVGSDHLPVRFRWVGERTVSLKTLASVRGVAEGETGAQWSAQQLRAALIEEGELGDVGSNDEPEGEP
jgi:hypothetical protein